MSSSNPPRLATENPTRQMLDELDQLMERMLALPVTDAAPGVGIGTAASPQADTAAPANADRAGGFLQLPPLLEFETPASPAPAEVPTSGTPAHLQGPHIRPVPPGKVIVGRLSAPPLYTAPDENLSEKDKEATPGDEQPLEVIWSAAVDPPRDPLPPLIVAPPTKVQLQVALRRRSLLGWLILLLLLPNRAFDRSTHGLGGMGRWLRSAAGRMVLGVTGIVLLAVAAFWYLHDWLGWNWFRVFLK